MNAMVADFVADANAARPITAGGMGATTAIGGADNLSTQGTAIASATTTDIGAATGRYVHITGTTTITGLGTKTAGVVRILTFDDALTLTHNATSLILPGAANINTAAGDTAVMVSEGSGNWRCLAYNRVTGVSIGASEQYLTATGSRTLLATERGKFFRKTNGAATWAPQAAATCGDGWAVTIKVEDEALTIDPQGAETIDGAATLVVPAGTTVRLWCNGTAFFSSFIAKPRVTGLFLNNGDELTFFKRGTLVHDFPSIAAQSYQSVDVAVTGATVTNQIAFANSNSIGDGLVLTARVFSTGTLRILVHNPTAAAIDPGNATLSWAIIG